MPETYNSFSFDPCHCSGFCWFICSTFEPLKKNVFNGMPEAPFFKAPCSFWIKIDDLLRLQILSRSTSWPSLSAVDSCGTTWTQRQSPFLQLLLSPTNFLPSKSFPNLSDWTWRARCCADEARMVDDGHFHKKPIIHIYIYIYILYIYIT